MSDDHNLHQQLVLTIACNLAEAAMSNPQINQDPNELVQYCVTVASGLLDSANHLPRPTQSTGH